MLLLSPFPLPGRAPSASSAAERPFLYALFRGKQRRRQRRRTEPQPPVWVDVLEDRTLLSSTVPSTTIETAGLDSGASQAPVLPEGMMGIRREPAEWSGQAAQTTGPAETPYPLEETFLLHSNPGSNFTIYLDFTGHVVEGTAWNAISNLDTIINPPFDIDGDPDSFSEAELDLIQRAWQMAAEDFAPFDVNVTTEEPPLGDLIRSGGGDTRWGVRVVMTEDTFLDSGAGGVAFIDSFNWDTDTPAYVFNSGLIGVAEAISHEVGHTLGLDHDGFGEEEYYWGHGTGPLSWGPIMGAGYLVNVTQWSNSEYFNATNTGPTANFNRGPDDLQIITTANGFGYRPSDHGNTPGSATDLEIVNFTEVRAEGIIERNDDVDFFRFATGTGPVSFQLTGFSDRPNLKIWAGIYDSGNNLLAESNPGNSMSAGFTDLFLESGVYYLKVQGVGSHGVYNPATDRVEDPASPPWQVDPPLGFSSYGSMGFYSLTGTVNPPLLNFGDAPDSYGTLAASDGARHLPSGPRLGLLREAAEDGRPSTNALANPDEDGIFFLNSISPGSVGMVRVHAPEGGVLDAWIDFTGNGTFDPEDRIQTNAVLLAGDNLITFEVPEDASIGTTYARFRIAAEAGHVTGPTGFSPSGEVEDYRVEILPFQVISEVLFNPAGVDTGNEYIELRGTPNSTIPEGVYFVAVDGNSGSGITRFVYHLGGLEYGSNGYLVLLQHESPYEEQVHSDANVVVSTENGWRDFNDRVRFLGRTTSDLDNGSTTFLLLHSHTRPLPGNRIDTNGDGTPDADVFAGWQVIDGVGVIAGANDTAYAGLAFSVNGGGSVPPLTTVVNVGTQRIDYVGRQGESVGNRPVDWVAGVLDPQRSDPSVIASAFPSRLADRPLDHFGFTNFDQSSFGSAPDSYGTLLASSGARHAPGGPILGVRETLTSDGRPSVDAGGEGDGIVMGDLMEGSANTLSIRLNNVSGSAVLQAWFDWNGDGRFNSAGEMVINQTFTGSGLFPVTVTPPVGSYEQTGGVTYARFRVSTAGDLGPTGFAVDGEVEDYVVTILNSATHDFGSAPDSYGTRLADNGARHLADGPTLGELRAATHDARPRPNGAPEPDEDGVTFATAIAPDSTPSVFVEAPEGGVLNAWIDFSRNGVFGPDERIFTDQVLEPGTNLLTFDVPAGALVGTTFARFRITSEAGVVTGPTGPAPDGEVEDYVVEILPIFNRPPVVEAQSFEVLEGSSQGTPVGQVQASDPDLGQSLRFQIIGGNQNQAFALAEESGLLTVRNPLAIDHQIFPQFQLTVRVTDTGTPALSRTATITVDVGDVGGPRSFGIPEGAPVGTIVGRAPLAVLDAAESLQYEIVGGNTGAAFQVDSQGVVRVSRGEPLDYVVNPVFSLEVRATQTGTSAESETVTMTVKLIERNKRPTVNDQVMSVHENAPAGALVGRIIATDPNVDQLLQYTIYRGNENGAFSIDIDTGEIRVADPALLNFSARPQIKLGVLVTDTGSPPHSDDAIVTVNLQKDLFLDRFRGDVLRPEWSVTEGNATIGDPALPGLVMRGAGSGTEVHRVVLELDATGLDNLRLAMNRRILGAATSGQVELSVDGGASWILLNTFDGAAIPEAQINVPRTVVLQLSGAAAARGVTLQGPFQVRFTTTTTDAGSGLALDPVRVLAEHRGTAARDVLVFDESSAQWVLGINDGSRFVPLHAADWPVESGSELVFGDFNGDGRTDVATLASNGEWWVGLSNGTGLATAHWATWNADAGWQDFLVGDFNGDGRDDVAARTANGQWWIARSTGTSFATVFGGTWAVDGWNRFLVGDFNGDGRDDVAGEREDGNWWMAQGTSSGRFQTVYAGRWSAATTWSDVVVGDFNGNGRAGIAGRDGAGQWWIGNTSDAGRLGFTYGGRWSATAAWEAVLVGDFTGDGRDDILGRLDNGQWWLNRSLGSSMQTMFFGQWNGNVAWKTVVGDFNNDGVADVAGLVVETGAWFIGLGGGERLQTRSFGDWGGQVQLAGSAIAANLQ